ncbi:unnamed protein product, partial [Rotaria magnacalcarata]
MPPTKVAEAMADVVEKYINEHDVMIFSKSWCPYCKKIKEALRSANIEFFVIELDKIDDGELILAELINRTEQETVPNIFIKKQHIGGCDKTLEALKQGQVATLLNTTDTEIKHQGVDNDTLDSYDYDLIVIGGGSGGLACSKEARSFDKKVCVLDFVKPTPIGTTWGLGGTCVNVGCIPKKLMHQASMIGEYANDSNDYGWSQLEKVRQHDWSKMMQSIQTYIRSLNFKYRTDLRSKDVVYENAYGQFVSPHRLKLTDKKGQTKEITGKYIVVAVGGRPKYPNIEGDTKYGITSDDLFSLNYDPGKTIVVGASYVALECAGFLHGIGREVHIFVRSILLRGFDQQMASKIGDYMSSIGIQFHHQTIPTRIECLEEGKPGKLRLYYRQTLESGDIKETYEDCNTVLFAIGREACTQDLNLDQIGIHLNHINGFKIKTKEEQSIHVSWLYAIGDCIDEQTMPLGKPLELTPVAIQAGQFLARRLFSTSSIKMDYYNIPTTVFTPIEYGAIGYCEEDAILQLGQDNIEVFHSEFIPLEWAICHHREEIKAKSYCKLIVEKKTDRVIGFHVLSPNSGEITQGYAVAMRLGATKNDFDMTVGIHPTCSENLTTLSVTKSSGDSVEKEEFLQNTIDKNQIVYLVISDRFLEFPIPHIHNLISIGSIYVYGQNINQYESWSNKYFKLKGHLFREISELCYQLTQDIRHYENNLIPIHIFENRLTENQLNQLEPNFMYSQLLKEILININYDEKVKKEFIQYCILHSNILNIKQMNIIDEFENDYEKHSPIWWYTRECFVYQMLNNALRTGNIETLIKMGFFIRDLHRQIQHLYCSQEHSTMIVYRGQGMTNNQFENLSKCKGGLISFLNFLSTSRNKQISIEFARQAIEKRDLRGIIFRMKIDRNMISLSNPYASINKLSYFKNSEKEILFSTHAVFRIEDIRPMKNVNKIWQVYLKLTTNQDDVQLEQLTKHLRQDVQYLSNPWESLAKLMLTMREFDKAQEIYENILEKTSSNDKEQLAFIYHQLGCVHNEKQNLNQSLEYFKLSLDIKANYLPGNYNDPQLADTYSNIGSIYHAQANLDNALLYFQDALNTNSNDQRVLASIYNNIGVVLKRQGYFHNALKHFQKSLQIDLNSLPLTHPDLATTYSNIGR